MTKLFTAALWLARLCGLVALAFLAPCIVGFLARLILAGWRVGFSFQPSTFSL